MSNVQVSNSRLAEMREAIEAAKPSAWTFDDSSDLLLILAELQALRDAPEVSSGTTYDDAGKAAWDFVRPTLLERGRDKGYAGVWADGFRQGWQSAERSLAQPQPNEDRVYAVTMKIWDQWHAHLTEQGRGLPLGMRLYDKMAFAEIACPIIARLVDRPNSDEKAGDR